MKFNTLSLKESDTLDTSVLLFLSFVLFEVFFASLRSSYLLLIFNYNQTF
jgi:hypothetical protein